MSEEGGTVVCPLCEEPIEIEDVLFYWPSIRRHLEERHQ